MVLSREQSRSELIRSGKAEPAESGMPGVRFRPFVFQGCGASDFYTGMALLSPGARIPCHTHTMSEAFTVLSGEPLAQVANRRYRLSQHDCLHVPSGVPHLLINDSAAEAVLLTSFGSGTPDRQFVDEPPCTDDRGFGSSETGDPESLIRFAEADVYELAPRAYFRDLFGGKFGAVGICGGYGVFEPGASLPCHFHEYDESITIIAGRATCRVEGSQYTLSGFDTAYIPKGLRHRFLNETQDPMAMLWVYAGSDPERTVVNAGYCSGELLPDVGDSIQIGAK